MTQPTAPPGTGAEQVAVTERVARKVRGLMGEQRISGRELAERTGIDMGTVHRRVRGDLPGFRLDELIKVAAALDVTVSDLVGDARPPAPPEWA